MTLVEKIKKFLEVKGMSAREFCKLSSIPTSNLSEYLNGNRDVTLPVVKRAADAMGVTTDFLLDDAQGWPPPQPDDRVLLTAVERKILEIAHDVSKDDPSMYEALSRLYLIDYAPRTGLPPAPIAVDQDPNSALNNLPAPETKPARSGHSAQPIRKKA